MLWVQFSEGLTLTMQIEWTEWELNGATVQYSAHSVQYLQCTD